MASISENTYQCNDNNNPPCGRWSTKAPMLIKRQKFACDSGPDKDATGTVTGVNGYPRVYVCGGSNKKGYISECEKYNPNNDQWVEISSLPEPLGDSDGVFVPDYGVQSAQGLGYIYVAGGNVTKIFRYDIKKDEWSSEPLPFKVKNASIQYLDDFGGPLAELFIDTIGVDIPACTDGKTLWIIGGEGTETKTWYIQVDINGNLFGQWIQGPDLPVKRRYPLVGRVFWRDTGITSFGVSNCASIIVSGGEDKHGESTKEVQILIRNKQCNWQWVNKKNNPSQIPDELLTLSFPVSRGDAGTEQWPETLVTGGRPILFGGDPPVNNFQRCRERKHCDHTQNKITSFGSTQFSQVRFFDGRYQPFYCYDKINEKSYWKMTTNMPGNRTEFKTAPLSQDNSSNFGGNRVSRFLCIGGKTFDGCITNRVQLFELPVPPVFVNVK